MTKIDDQLKSMLSKLHSVKEVTKTLEKIKDNAIKDIEKLNQGETSYILLYLIYALDDDTCITTTEMKQNISSLFRELNNPGITLTILADNINQIVEVTALRGTKNKLLNKTLICQQ